MFENVVSSFQVAERYSEKIQDELPHHNIEPTDTEYQKNVDLIISLFSNFLIICVPPPYTLED